MSCILNIYRFRKGCTPLSQVMLSPLSCAIDRCLIEIQARACLLDCEMFALIYVVDLKNLLMLVTVIS